MPLLSLCLDQRTNVILPRLSGIVNVVFIFCAIQNILTFLCFSSVLRLSKLFPYSPESESLKTFNFYNFVIAMIPGSKGQKAAGTLLRMARLNVPYSISKYSLSNRSPTFPRLLLQAIFRSSFFIKRTSRLKIAVIFS